ncbi:ATP-binding protein [Clostridium sp. P21]|uniref:ATP-binding protein n=1 Tax=Clostridium muellerianum TaxID=2716538 RepID=A0A7Y0ECV0_9CLOT|nr:ATP-binding protein [Clostridium muellerianum]NMM61159.1 ATP-binding protein [Clostridium muellerianum]
MLNKDINQITEEDLQSLIDNGVLEGKTIEYKKEIHYSNDSEKKELLADVSSFANAVGGILILGVEEDRETGLPKSLCGLDISNIDEEIRKVESIIRDGISPKIPKLEIGYVRLKSGNIVLIIKIHRSWLSPHRIIFKGWDKFFSRNTNRKYPLDVNELRNAFNLSSTITDKIRLFVQERISKLNINETPIPYKNDVKLIMHLIPFESFGSNNLLHVKDFQDEARKLKPIYSFSWNYKINFDGHLIYNCDKNNLSSSFVQCYRNGIVEYVNSSMFEGFNPTEKIIPSVLYEQELISTLEWTLNYFQNINIECPIFLFLSLVNIKDYEMAVDRTKHWFSQSKYKVDRDMLITPEMIIDNYNMDTKSILRPVFDSIWNACGLSESLNYDKENNFRY